MGAADSQSDVRRAVLEVKSGNAEAFGRIVEIFQRRLFALTLVLTRDASAAEEVAQDAFVRAFTHLRAYDERRPFYPWLATISVRLAQNWLKRRARAVAREGHHVGQAAQSADAGNPLAAMIAGERGEEMWRRVAALPPGERAAVMLHYRQGMSTGEVARALGVTGGTVKTLLFRARKKLRMAAAESQPGKESQ